MKIELNKNEIFLLIEALESYQLDIEHGEDNGHNNYPFTEKQAEKLRNKLNTIAEKCLEK